MQRSELLTALELPDWRLRSRQASKGKAESAAALTVDTSSSMTADEIPVEVAPTAVQANSRNSVPAAAMAGTVAPVPSTLPIPANDSWEALESEIRACRACGLCQLRKQVVPGQGDRNADWLFVGDGPGAEEDAVGEPFVGQAGQLLDGMLRSIGLKRGEKIYLADAVKCRPPGNRTPDATEIAACRPFLQRQIALLKPRLIVVLGRSASQSVLASDATLSAQRGKVARYEGIPVVVTYHPSYLLRTPLDKLKVWEDLCLARMTFQTAEI